MELRNFSSRLVANPALISEPSTSALRASLVIPSNPIVKDNMLSQRDLEEKQRLCPRPWGTLDRLPREILFHIMGMVLNGSVEAVHDRLDVPHVYPSMAHILTRVNSAWFGWGVPFVWEKVRMRCFTKIFRPRLRVYSNYVTTLYGCDTSLYGGPEEILGAFDFPNIRAIRHLRLNDQEDAYVSIIAAKVNDVKELSIRLDFNCNPTDAPKRILKYISLFPGIESLNISGDYLGCPHAPKVLDGILQLTSLTQLKLSIRWRDVKSYRCLSQLSKLTRLDIYCLPDSWPGEHNSAQFIPGWVDRHGTLREALEIIKPLENLRRFLFRTLSRVTIADVEAFFEGIVREKPKLRELSIQLEHFCNFMPQNFGASLTQYNSPLTRLVVYSDGYDCWAEDWFTRIFPKLKLFTVFKPEKVFAAEEVIGMDFRSVV